MIKYIREKKKDKENILKLFMGILYIIELELEQKVVKQPMKKQVKIN